MSYRTEFLDFELGAGIDPAAAGFPFDWSYHNDVCPSFADGDDATACYAVWIDYVDPATREDEFAPRFRIVAFDRDETGAICHHETALLTDDWNEVVEFGNRQPRGIK